MITWFATIGHADNMSWLGMRPEPGSIYLAVLAETVGRINNLSPVTDAPRVHRASGSLDRLAAWLLGTPSPAPARPDVENAYLNVALKAVIEPDRLDAVPVEKTLTFRERRNAELAAFRAHVAGLGEELPAVAAVENLTVTHWHLPLRTASAATVSHSSPFTWPDDGAGGRLSGCQERHRRQQHDAERILHAHVGADHRRSPAVQRGEPGVLHAEGLLQLAACLEDVRCHRTTGDPQPTHHPLRTPSQPLPGLPHLRHRHHLLQTRLYSCPSVCFPGPVTVSSRKGAIDDTPDSHAGTSRGGREEHQASGVDQMASHAVTATAAADGFRQSRRNGWRSLQRLHRRCARQSLFRTLAGSVVVCDPVLARRALADVDGLFEHTPAFWCPREVPLEPPLRRQLTKWIRTAAEAQDVEAVGAAAVDEVAATGGDLHLACLRALAHANSAVLGSDDVPELEGVVREYVDTIAYPMIVGTARDNSRGRRIRQLSERAGEVLTRTRPPALPGVMIDGTTVDSWLAGRIYLESILAVVGGSSVALAWLTCMMSLPEVAGLRHDLDATRSAAPRDVAHEVLRLWPPAWQHRRHVRQDHKIGTVRVLRGDDVVVPVYSLHRRHDLWPNANAFDPHRWSTMASPPEAFLPFAAGPRACVGARFEEHLLAAAARRLAARPRLPLTAMREEPCVTTALSPPPHLIRM